MASEYRCGFSNELEFSLINYLSKMLCDSNRRLSNTRITARCQIIYFPLVFPAPEVLKHNSQNDLPIPSSISCPKPEVTTTSCRVQGPTLTRPGFCICLTSFPAFDATLFLPHWVPGFPWTGTPGSGPASVPTHRLFSSLGQPFLSYFTSRSLLS